MQIHAISTQQLAPLAMLPVGADPQPLLVMPCTDVPMARRAASLMSQRAATPGHILLVEDLDGWGFIRIVNEAFRKSDNPYFGYVAQDVFAGRQWLAFAMAALRQDGKGLFAFSDGKWHGAMAGFGLATRAWASRNYGDASFFFPGYSRHFADVELSLLAMNDGCYIHDPRSLLVEVDWDKDTSQVAAQDRGCFQQRKTHGFEGRVMKPELLGLFS